MTAPNLYAVVTGGGTGGHVTPALAIADELVARGHPIETIRFVGASRGLESHLVPDAGYSIELFRLDGIQRSLAPRDVVRSIRAVGAFFRVLVACVRLLRRLRPAVVVGVGGYASAPCVLAGLITRTPTVIHEQNAVPGLVNRIAVRCGARPMAGFAIARWPRAVVTGNPVRAEIASIVRHPVSPPVVAVVGGSQGAGALNDVALGLYDRWRHRDDVAVHHIAGPKHFDQCTSRLGRLRRPDDRLAYELVAFEQDMARVYATSSLLLARGGATTIAEAAVVGIPAVFVPWSGSAEGQQTANASTMVEAGAAEMVADRDCDVTRVEPMLSNLLADPGRRAGMERAARAVGRPDAAQRLGAVIEELARVRA